MEVGQSGESTEKQDCNPMDKPGSIKRISPQGRQKRSKIDDDDDDDENDDDDDGFNRETWNHHE